MNRPEWPTFTCSAEGCEEKRTIQPAAYRFRLRMAKHGKLYCSKNCASKEFIRLKKLKPR